MPNPFIEHQDSLREDIQELAAELAEKTEECRVLMYILSTIWDDDEISERIKDAHDYFNRAASPDYTELTLEAADADLK